MKTKIIENNASIYHSRLKIIQDTYKKLLSLILNNLLVTRDQKQKINIHFENDCTSTAGVVGKLMVFNSGFGSEINL